MKGLRKDDPRNFGMLCKSDDGENCHDEHHKGTRLTRANVLYFKMTNDPLNWDFDFLSELFKGNGRAILEEPEAPSWVLPPWIT